ncbi:MAG: methylenetetrahydrofolate reductase [NAD(P)H] [Caldithrix sp.]|nr:methylenetetrahydrofolate reductase [NAD(P)H] [Caldithrix sp.]
MKVIEHLAKANDTLISFEIIPPRRGGTVKSLLKVVDDIARFNPPFIDITSHAAEAIYEETADGIKRKVKRKRPGTLGICALIQNKYNIDAVPHVLCNGFTREETEDFLIDLQYLGIENVLAIRGDESNYKKPIQHGRSVNAYAVDLVRQIDNMNRGRYLEEELLDSEPSNFCIGVGGYPEKHYEAPNLETDISYLKEKIEAGADYIATQMVFNNRAYFDFVERSRAAGIKAPIIPGLKIVTSRKQLRTIPKNFYVDLPAGLVQEIQEAPDQHVLDIGLKWARQQAEELLNANVPAIHFYIMQNARPIKQLMDQLL